jgi:hypothetical protein
VNAAELSARAAIAAKRYFMFLPLLLLRAKQTNPWPILGAP